MPAKTGGFGLYLHWPFCQSKCPYCDFNSHVTRHIDQDRWRRAYLAEIARIGRETPGREVDSIFFGGGTPSLMEPELIAAILDAIRATWPVAETAEITLEANPSSVEAGRFRGYRDAGVNRVSLGVQALDDAALARLGRLHSVAQARDALEVAHTTFDRTSFDLIYARQGQTAADWRAELREALSMAAGHLSLYQLTIEPGTAFGDRYARGGLRDLPDDEQAADLFELTQELCSAAGMAAYETSNHAAPGAESCHNLVYWRSGDYAGIGPGAHGRLTFGQDRIATDTLSEPSAWLSAVETAGSGERPRTTLTGADHAAEYLMMGLRLREGVSRTRYAHLAGKPLDSEALQSIVDLGLLESDGDPVRTTPAGRPLLNAILRELLAA